MALTPEQRAQIKARAQILIDGGMSAGPAAQQALRELIQADPAVAQQFPTYTPPPTTVSPEFPVAEREAEREEQLREIAQVQEAPTGSLEAEEERYRMRRVRELQLQDPSLSDAAAGAIAQREVIEEYKKPVPFGFGTPSERAEEGIGVRALEAVLPTERQIEEVVPPPRPIEEETIGQPGVGVDWNAIQQGFIDDLGIPEEDASADVDSFKQNFYRPALDNVREQGLTGAEAVRAALDSAFEEFSDLGRRLSDKDSYITDDPTIAGPNDPWYRAFSRQEDIGEGIPDLTEAQRRYLNDRQERQLNRIRNTPQIANEVQRRLDEEDLEVDTREYIDRRAEIEEDVLDEQRTWWLEEDFQERINRPDIYTQYGAFGDVTPLGTRKETVSGWLLRSAISPFNIVPAFIAEAVAPGEEAVEYDFTDRILTNVAENRGFMGEGEAIMRESGITPETAPLQYYGGMAAGLALDILDPSIDLAKAGIIGTKRGLDYSRTMNRLYGEIDQETLSEAAGLAYRKARESFYDDYIIHNLIGARYDAGSVRNLAAGRLSRDIDAAIQAEDILKATPEASVNDALEQLSDHSGTAYYNFLAARNGEESFESAVRAARDLIKVEDDVLTQATRISDDIENMRAGNEPINLPKAKIARVTRSISLFNDRFKKELLEGGIEAVLEDDELVKLLKRGLASNEALEAVAKSTRDLPANLDNVIALTDNTYAGRGAAKKIIDRVKKSDAGKLLSELDPDSIQIMKSPGGEISASRFEPAYVFKEEPGETNRIADGISDIIYELEQLEAIDPRRAWNLRQNIRGGPPNFDRFITVSDVRYLLDKITDTIAESIAISDPRTSILRAPDVQKLAPQRQVELMQPFERRTLTSGALKSAYRALRGDKPIEMFAGPAQRNMLKRAAVEGESIVRRLGNRIKELLKNPELQRAYEIPEDQIDRLTPRVVIDLLIKGTRSGNMYDNLYDTLKFTLMSNFQTNKTIQNLYDNIAGTSVTSNTSPFTNKLLKEIDDEIQRSVDLIALNKSLFSDELRRLINIIESKVQANPQLFRYPLDEVTNIFKKSIGDEVDDVVVSITGESRRGAIPTDLLISAYIKAESTRITDQLLEEFIESGLEDIGFKTYGDLVSNIQMNLQLKEGDMLDILGIDSRGKIVDQTVFDKIKKIMMDSVKYKMRGKSLLEEYQESLLRDSDDLGIVNLFGRERIQRTLDLPEDLSPELIQATLKLADDYANRIMKANDIVVSPDNISELERLMGIVTDSRGKEMITALYGEDVANQINRQFNEGFSNVRNQLIDDMRSQYGMKSVTEQRIREIKAIGDALQSLRYFIMLNLRPRFHAVNLLTGSEIYYQNLGRLPNIKDVAIDAPRILAGIEDPNKIMLTTPAGKPYTLRELDNILRDATGKSVYRPDLFNTNDDLKYIKDLIDSGGTSNITEIARAAQALPQNEDLMFRYAALAQALREGRSESEAIELARKAMFDRADVTNLERKSIGRASLFYSFARNALVTALRNLTSLKGLKRIKNIARGRDFAQNVLLPEGTEEREIADFAPNYAAARVITGVKPIDAKKGKYEIMTTPPIPTIQAFDTFAEILKGDISGILTGFVSPELKYLFNIQDPYAREYEEVPAEHLAILDSIDTTTGVNATEDVLNLIMFMFGGKPMNIPPTPTRNPDGSISTSYKFVTPSQKRAYRNFMYFLGVTGTQTVASDLGRALPTAQPVRGAELDLLQDTLGFTPMSAYTPEKQAYFDRISRMSAIRDAANKLRAAENERVDAVTPLTPQQEEVEERFESAQERVEEIERELRPEVKGVMRINEIRNELRRRDISPARRRELMNEYRDLIRQQRNR